MFDQNYPRLEYAVMDGGSANGPREVIERYAGRLHHWRSAALADGFARTSGEIMAWFGYTLVITALSGMNAVAAMSRCAMFGGYE